MANCNETIWSGILECKSKIIRVIVIYLWSLQLFPSIVRVEKEKIQYYSECNDLRTSVDHLSNEKVSPRTRPR